MTQERWLPVVGKEEFYDVSDTGFVRSKHPVRTKTNGELMRQQCDRQGYQWIFLSGNGKRIKRFVHRLVLKAFVGPPPSATHQTNHKNGIKNDNQLSNLEWVTPAENVAHAVASGLRRRDPRNNTKLNEDKVRLIRASKDSIRNLAKRYGVVRGAIYQVKNRVNWKHVV